MKKAARILGCNLTNFKSSLRISEQDKDNRDLLIYLLWETGLFKNQETGDLLGLTYSSISRRAAIIRERIGKDNRIKKQFKRLLNHKTRCDPGSKTRCDPGSYFDTFGYSMGGLISRCLQSNHGRVHNMVLAGTPNHGTHSVLECFDNIPVVNAIKEAAETWSPGTADLFPYDDEDNLLTTRRLGDAGTSEATTVMEYDASDNMTSVTDPEGNIIWFGFFR